MKQPNLGDKIYRVYLILRKLYGQPALKPSLDPLSSLVMTLLSQNTTDLNSDRAFENLVKRFPTWDQVRTAPVVEIADAIRVGGLAQIKAGRIKAILDEIYRERGVVDLSFLTSLDTAEIMEYLGHFPGVGDKTIACVLLFSLGRPVMPVDTHVRRVSERLGLVPSRTNAAAAHQILRKIVPEELVYSLHLNLIEHGRKICRARGPRCESCPLGSECDWFQSITPQM